MTEKKNMRINFMGYDRKTEELDYCSFQIQLILSFVLICFIGIYNELIGFLVLGIWAVLCLINIYLKPKKKEKEKTELKTLKDLVIYIKDNQGRVSYDELKAEAIKWVKKYPDLQNSWMMRDFMDIKEEDLK